MTIQQNNNKPRGFAALSPEQRKSISSKGGKSAHAAGTAHKFDSSEGRAAGVKGGKASSIKRAAKTTIATSAPKTTKKDPHRMVKVQCSSAAGCDGVQHADKAGDDMIGELPTKGKKVAEAKAPEALSGKDDLAQGKGGGGGCGSGCSS